MAENKDTEALTTLFKIVIPDLRDMVFTSCEGLESEIEVESLFEGGSLAAPKTVRGPQKVNKITFGHGTSGDKGGKSLFDWYLEVCDSSKELQKKVISIMVIDRDGKELAEWRVKNAWPCRWVAPMMSRDLSALSIETISFAHEGIERKK